MTVSPQRYRLITVVALCSLIFIIVTGASVRLTGSGLGCSDWPHCNSERFVDVSDKHAAIEQINRLITGLVSVAVVAAVLGSWFRSPRRRDLVVLSVAMAAGIPAQAMLGAVTVWTHLHPLAVQAHMLLSLVLVAIGVVLVQRAGSDLAGDGDIDADTGDGRRAPVAALEPGVVRHVWLVGVLTAVAVVAGTVVTGAGPHAGDEDVQRFDVSIPAVTRVHGIAVIVAVVSMLALALRLRRRHVARRRLGELISSWVFVALLQGAVGYIQYFSDVPPLLVGIHVFGASVLWAITVAIVGRAHVVELDEQRVNVHSSVPVAT